MRKRPVKQKPAAMLRERAEAARVIVVAATISKVIKAIRLAVDKGEFVVSIDESLLRLDNVRSAVRDHFERLGFSFRTGLDCYLLHW